MIGGCMRTGSVLVQFSGLKRVDRCRLCNEHREDPGSFSQIPSGGAVNQGKPGDSRVPFFPGRKTNVKGGAEGVGDVGLASLTRRMHGLAAVNQAR